MHAKKSPICNEHDNDISPKKQTLQNYLLMFFQKAQKSQFCRNLSTSWSKYKSYIPQNYLLVFLYFLFTQTNLSEYITLLINIDKSQTDA